MRARMQWVYTHVVQLERRAVAVLFEDLLQDALPRDVCRHRRIVKVLLQSPGKVKVPLLFVLKDPLRSEQRQAAGAERLGNRRGRADIQAAAQGRRRRFEFRGTHILGFSAGREKNKRKTKTICQHRRNHKTLMEAADVIRIGTRSEFLKAVCVIAKKLKLCSRRGRKPLFFAKAHVSAVFTAFADPLQRVVQLGGRQGMPRSIGSLYACLVALFLMPSFRGKQTHAFPTPGVRSRCNGVALTRDGSMLLVSDNDGGSHGVHVFNVCSGAHLRTIGCLGDGPLQFDSPLQVSIASDDFVFVARVWQQPRAGADTAF
jgi:hypothetical protein